MHGCTFCFLHKIFMREKLTKTINHETFILILTIRSILQPNSLFTIFFYYHYILLFSIEFSLFVTTSSGCCNWSTWLLNDSIRFNSLESLNIL